MELFKSNTELLNSPGELIIYRGHFDDEEDILENLNQVNFIQNKIIMYGKEYLVPRLEAWFGDESYTYTGVKLKPLESPIWLNVLKAKVQTITGNQYNSVLINKYRNGDDYVSYHQDNEPELGRNPVIASLSFGSSRKFTLRSLADKNKKVEIELSHGDLLLMGQNIQYNWEHQLKKSTKSDGIRYNLTFRNIKMS